MKYLSLIWKLLMTEMEDENSGIQIRSLPLMIFLFSEGFWNPNLYAYISQANILSITDTGAGSKLIRVLMSPSDKTDNIYAIVNYVFKDNKLSNYTDFYTEKWTEKNSRNIEYHFPSDYSFNSASARQANVFVK